VAVANVVLPMWQDDMRNDCSDVTVRRSAAIPRGTGEKVAIAGVNIHPVPSGDSLS